MTEQPSEEPQGIVITGPTEPAPPEVSQEVADAPPPPPPLEAPPAPESLAEQVQRERTEVVESVGPSDVVPNRPQIRDPQSYAAPEEEGEPVATEEIVEPAADGEPVVQEHQSAADLIAAAQAAETEEELAAIEAQAEDRVTVLDAVDKRREELQSA